MSPSIVHVIGVQMPGPHWFPTPTPMNPPPHVRPGMHVPQLSIPPQPSIRVPQLAPRAAQVSGTQPHTLGAPAPPHVWGVVHVPLPHVTTVPHALVSVPQSSGAGQDVKSGVQPHTLAVTPPPHVLGAVHAAPQLAVPPHPSGTNPQFAPTGHAPVVQPHTFGVPLPPHVSEPMHTWHAAPPVPHASCTAPGWQLPIASQQPLHIPFAVPHEVPHCPVTGLQALPSGQPAAEVHGTNVSGGGAESKAGLVSGKAVESTVESTGLPESRGSCVMNVSVVASGGSVKLEQDGHSPLSASPQPASDSASSAMQAHQSTLQARETRPAFRPTPLVDELTTLPEPITGPRSHP